MCYHHSSTSNKKFLNRHSYTIELEPTKLGVVNKTLSTVQQKITDKSYQ